MLRFCDKEICCVTQNEMNWQQLADYFLDWHMDEKIYVMNENGKYVGSIVYNSIFGIRPENAIQSECIILDGDKRVWVIKDYVILDENIWINGRKYFKICGGLLPVLNQEHQLICFAWNDNEADREIRMLDELAECEAGIGFRDIYLEADCVTIHGCNELSYFFSQYLRKTGVPVNVIGEFWDTFGIWENIEVPDFRNFIIYAEGNNSYQEEEAEIRESVSADFECIDKIYEENILRGYIHDTNEQIDGILRQISRAQIVIIGTGKNSLDAYDILIGHGIDICCFISENSENYGRVLFGKKVMKRRDVVENVKNPVFIETSSKYSAWGLGGTDFYHYIGYKRNKNFYLLQDYTEIIPNGFMNILEHIADHTERKLLLIGDYYFCLKLFRILNMKKIKLFDRIGYYDVLGENRTEKKELLYVNSKWAGEDDLCLLLLPGYIGCFDDSVSKHLYRETVRRKYLEQASKNNISMSKVIDYPLKNMYFMNDALIRGGSAHTNIKVRGIVLGAIDYHSGNQFFRGILDNHPEILMLQYGLLNSNLFYLCIRLSMESSSNISRLFWKMYESVTGCSECKELGQEQLQEFNGYMKDMLAQKETFTSQELFVMIHIAYARIWNKNIQDTSNMLIYWEPHNISREDIENFAIWLSMEGTSGYIVNVVRNTYIKRGSELKCSNISDWSLDTVCEALYHSLSYADPDKKVYNGWKRVAVKFEDLKCNPETELQRICDELELSWSDTLLETTLHGQQDSVNNITGFDLAPVYRTYDEYYSAFDRMRITLMAGLWQKQYGYPYIRSTDFSRKELREMFSKAFYLEEIAELSDIERKDVKKRLQGIISNNLWKVRRDEIMQNQEETVC